MKKTRGEGKQFVGKKNILETFIGEKEEEQEKYFIIYFILPQEAETPERVKPLNRQDVQIFCKCRLYRVEISLNIFQ